MALNLDGKYFWMGQPGGPIAMILLDADNINYPLITSANDQVGDVIGRLTAISDNPNETFVYSLLANPENKFAIDGNLLKAAAGFNVNQTTTHYVKVRATAAEGLFIDAEFTISVDDSVGGEELDNFAVLLTALNGTSSLADLTLQHIHVVGLRNLHNGPNGALINSMDGVKQAQVINLSAMNYEFAIASITVTESPDALMGSSSIADLSIQQQHQLGMVSPQFATRYIMDKLILNAITLNPIDGIGEIGQLTVQSNAHVRPLNLTGGLDIDQLVVEDLV